VATWKVACCTADRQAVSLKHLQVEGSRFPATTAPLPFQQAAGESASELVGGLRQCSGSGIQAMGGGGEGWARAQARCSGAMELQECSGGWRNAHLKPLRSKVALLDLNAFGRGCVSGCNGRTWMLSPSWPANHCLTVRHRDRASLMTG